MLEGNEAIGLLQEELIRELNGRFRGCTVMIDHGPKETRDFERFDVYMALPYDLEITNPEDQIDQFEVVRGLVNNLSSEISERMAQIKSYENISVSGIGIHQDIDVIPNPPEFEALFADIPETYCSWKLSFYVCFAHWPTVEVRGEGINYPSELLIFMPTEMREEYQESVWAKRFPKPEEDEIDPFTPEEGQDDEKPSFN